MSNALELARELADRDFELLREEDFEELTEAVSELTTEAERLRECLRRAGLCCFLRLGTKPEQVADHMAYITRTWLEEEECWRETNKEQRQRIAELEAQLCTKGAANE